MLLTENIKLAVNAIRINKMRSFLTMLGIIIGISSVIAITSIDSSAQGAIESEFESVGSGYLSIMPNWYSDDEITDDIYFTWDDAGGKPNIIIPKKAAINLFGKEDVVGMTLPVTVLDMQTDMNIVGVYDVPQTIFTAMDTSTRYTCYTAYSAISRSDWSTAYLEIYADDSKDIEAQALSFIAYLERYRDAPPNTYMYESAEGQMQMINEMLGYLSVAIGAIAAISLLIGGIGIMNIMLVSVTERTREIGIRKSLGARTKDILVQFLIEAMILSVFGGIIGTLLGIGITAAGTLIAGVRLVINPISVILTVAFSGATGLFFGLFPARKAAKLDPIEALRYE